MFNKPQIGVVAIGRNEGDRLKHCLRSILGKVALIVYVDSGSTDGSIELAHSLGVESVELDLSIPFTAARARNAGFKRLLELNPELEFVQFVDGDCEIVEDWLDYGMEIFQSEPQIGVVCGRRRERFPQASIYNLLCDLEWDVPSGEVKTSSGDALMRAIAFQQVNGYDPTLIAGEDPELCIRLRQQGWRIWRLDAEMTRHDAQMTRFGQWWKRSLRAGHAYAEGAWRYGRSPEKHWVKESRSIWLWGLLIPVIALIGTWFSGGWTLVLLAGYPLMVVKTFRSLQVHGWNFQETALYSSFCVLGKFPQILGQLQFHRNRLLGKPSSLIEYKAQVNS
ncbi:MAG: glycosyltransferase family 2 protein [Microcoleaceae cyanobacterium]